MKRTTRQTAAMLMICLSILVTGCRAASKTKQAAVLPHGSTVAESVPSNSAEVASRSLPPPADAASLELQNEQRFVATTPIDEQTPNSLRSGASAAVAATPSIENRMRLSQSYNASPGACTDACCRR